ncbi:MAG: hypothetical protein IT361_15315 [Gemmatimonadaceae bacterium]|nr:hypothetical protein [Gemmatimonadaceae bacterium]
MAKGDAVEFVGDTGPGAVINQYLPQPGQYSGRRILQVSDTPTAWWLKSASELGTPWASALGMVADPTGGWQIARPELLTATWFNRRRRLPRAGSARGLSLAQAAINRSAQDALLRQGSLRPWASRGGAAAKYYDYDPETGETEPNTSEPDIEPPGGGGGGDGGGGGSTTDDADEATVDFLDAIVLSQDGVIHIPDSTWGGGTTTTPIDVGDDPQPMFFIVQVIGISSFLGDYGLGRTVRTFTLLPGETTTISTRTWRATSASVEAASSIIDSYTESASDRFADTVMTETTDTATQAQTENWHAEAEVKGSFGFGSASVSGGGGGEYSSSTEEFAKAVDESVSEHSSESSAQRENTVTSNSESSEETEDEEVIERTISNINVRRVLNFTFRELNQVYLTRTHLKEVRIAFSNGNQGSWREEPISAMRKLVAEVIDPKHVDAMCQDLLRTIATAFDIGGLPVQVIEQVSLNPCCTVAAVTDAKPDKHCQYPAPTEDGRLYYRFRRGPLGQNPADAHPVDGVLLREREVVMATDSVVVEALLGQSDALDDYSRDLQVEAIREKQLANQREQLAQKIVASGDASAAALFAQVFAPPPPVATP